MECNFDSGNERRKVNRESDSEAKRADRCDLSYCGDSNCSFGFALEILIS